MHPQSHARVLALLSTLGAASCAASAPYHEHEAELVQPSTASPAHAEPEAAPGTTAVAPFDGDDADDDHSWLEWILYGPTHEPERDSLPGWDANRDDESWWIERPTAAERARLAGIFRAKQGWYLGALYGFTQHNDTDLDGQKVLSGADTIVLPDIDVGSGPGVVFGYRFETMAFEFRYLRTEHDATWLGNDFNVTYESFGVDFKQFYFREQRLQPFVVLGFSAPTLEIENGSFSGAATADGKLEDDFTLEVGAGLGFYLTPRLFVGGQGVYRFLESYDEAEGVASQGPSENVDAGGFLGSISLTYTF